MKNINYEDSYHFWGEETLRHPCDQQIRLERKCINKVTGMFVLNVSQSKFCSLNVFWIFHRLVTGGMEIRVGNYYCPTGSQWQKAVAARRTNTSAECESHNSAHDTLTMSLKSVFIAGERSRGAWRTDSSISTSCTTISGAKVTRFDLSGLCLPA